MAIDTEFGTRLRRLRLQRGFTQAELARPRYTHAYISTIESGRRTPSHQVMEFLAQKLGVHLDELETGRPVGLAGSFRKQLDEIRLEVSRGGIEDATKQLKRIIKEAHQFGFPRVEARGHEILALTLEQSGDTERALRHYDKAIELIRTDAPTSHAYAIAGLIRCHKLMNDPHQAIFIGESYLERLKKEQMASPASLVRVQSAMVLAYFAAGSRIKAHEVAEACQRLMPRVNDPAILATAYVNIAGVQIERGHHDDANVSLAKAEELFEVLELNNEAGIALLARGYNYARSDKLQAARDALTRASEHLAGTANAPEHANAEMELGRVDRLEGKSKTATRRLEGALDLIEPGSQPRLEAWAHRELGLALAVNDRVLAEKHFGRALELYEAEDLKLEIARTHVMIAELRGPEEPIEQLEEYRRAGAAILAIPEL